MRQAKDEVSYLGSKSTGDILIDQAFTRELLSRGIQARDFSILHFATHGQFGGTAESTFLLAWKTELKINELSDLLQTQERRQRSPIDLLVLSACQTAQGDRRAALGISGAAFRAGARSILASLWSINEQSSVDFVKLFYDNLLTEGQPKADAVRTAQIEMIRQGQPIYHWAPFTLIGKWT